MFGKSPDNPARILVVDIVPAGLRLMEARLLAEGFDVFIAASGREAQEICEGEGIDLVLLASVADMAREELCRRLKANRLRAKIVVITSADDSAAREAALSAGADDFLMRPIKDLHLAARLSNLLRLKALENGAEQTSRAKARVLLVEQSFSSAERVRQILAGEADVEIVSTMADVTTKAREGGYACTLVSTRLGAVDPITLGVRISVGGLPVILIADEGEDALALEALESGVNDLIVRPLERSELIARLRTQIRIGAFGAASGAGADLAAMEGLTALHHRNRVDGQVQRF